MIFISGFDPAARQPLLYEELYLIIHLLLQRKWVMSIIQAMISSVSGLDSATLLVLRPKKKTRKEEFTLGTTLACMCLCLLEKMGGNRQPLA
ncbi:unnamed protein product [Protopolystoma xenopodis]|uniref:Uncharacterized protein n=1 Tax=Protopolystoma xenopodis TaxID=117903 RepID=A0A448WT96_9PLAT|nr:unnamed protein product [Protopolystoma xenopodis]